MTKQRHRFNNLCRSKSDITNDDVKELNAKSKDVDEVLIDSTWQNVVTNEWGVTTQSLQNGAFYYLVRSFGYDHAGTIDLFLQNILDLYFKHFKLSEDVVNRILQVVLDLQHFKSSPFISAATILQSSSAIHHISNLDNMYIKSYSFSLFSSLPGVLTPVRGESLKILNGFDVSLPVSHSLWSSQSFGHQKAINGFDMPLPVAVCSGLVNPLAPRKGKFHGGLITMSTLCT
ncbi:hypothetical protein Tco_1368463 [Tanacetum coccineum]